MSLGFAIPTDIAPLAGMLPRTFPYFHVLSLHPMKTVDQSLRYFWMPLPKNEWATGMEHTTGLVKDLHFFPFF